MSREVRGLNHIVYFSSVTGYTHRFVEKVGYPASRIPLYPDDEFLVMDEDYLLIIPTYGGGVGVSGGTHARPVPPQVRKFLSHSQNVDHLMAVVATGNLNFGTDYGIAGDVISKKFGVPYVHRLELLGTPEDVAKIRDIMENINITVDR